MHRYTYIVRNTVLTTYSLSAYANVVNTNLGTCPNQSRPRQSRSLGVMSKCIIQNNTWPRLWLIKKKLQLIETQYVLCVPNIKGIILSKYWLTVQINRQTIFPCAFGMFNYLGDYNVNQNFSRSTLRKKKL